MAYRTDKFATGDYVVWFDEYYAKLARGRERHGEGPFVLTKVESPDYEDWTIYGVGNSTSNWDAMGHTQHVWIESEEGGKQRLSGAFFKKVEAKTGPSEEEIRAIAMTEIARRLELAKLALLQVDFDYEIRKGFISSDTMQTVTRALALLK